MAEKQSFRLVEVKASANIVEADFKRKNVRAAIHDSCINVLLSEADLELSGEEFVDATRKALHRMISEGRPVVLLRGETVEDREGRQGLGFLLDDEEIEQIEIKDSWRLVS